MIFRAVFVFGLISFGTASSYNPQCPEKEKYLKERGYDQQVCDNAKVASMAAFREDDREPHSILTSNLGVKIVDDANSLTAGEKGPTLLEDMLMREKLSHFDHERIPERVVHARGAGAHGYFQVYKSMSYITKAKFLQDPYTVTPVFVRFSTVVGGKGSADTVRDVRGFATKFYTEEGNFDLVGNNIPVFFIQDAIKFPDLIHAIKVEPQTEIPQASSAHDTFYDFITQTTEGTHMMMWLMSDRALPRSFSMMQGFGVNTFRLVNGTGHSKLVKFHWKPKLGVHSLVWQEAQKIAGKDPDFHRRLLFEDINAGNFPEYELGFQIIDEYDQEKYGFDLLDATKLLPEELVPVTPIGKMVLNRINDNFFAESEQVAMHMGNIVPGIDFTDDPLLQGRTFSYHDTQVHRLGGANFHEIPINRPLATIKNNQRDGFHRDTINVAKTAYNPNTINYGLPKEADANEGFVSYPEKVYGFKVRARPKSFDDHYSQARLFYKSLAKWEQEHIIQAFVFELSKLKRDVLRERMVKILTYVDGELAEAVAVHLNIDLPHKEYEYPKAVNASPALSQAYTVQNTILTRRVAIIVDNGVNGNAVAAMKHALVAAGAYVTLVAPRIGEVKVSKGDNLIAEATFKTKPSVLFDAIYIPGGNEKYLDYLEKNGDVMNYAFEAYKYYKSMAGSGAGVQFLEHAGLIPKADAYKNLPDGVITTPTDYFPEDFIQQFIKLIAKHRFYYREEVNAVPA